MRAGARRGRGRAHPHRGDPARARLRRARRGRLDRAREQASAAIHDAQAADDRLTYAHAASLLFLVDFLAGRGPDEAALVEALALEQAIDAAPRPTPPSVVQALRLMYLDRFDEARDAFAGALRRAANRGDEAMVDAVFFHSARLELRAGDWPRAADLATGSRGWASRTSGTARGSTRGSGRSSRRTREARARRRSRRRPSRGRRAGVRELEMQALLGFVELSRGHAAAAAQLLEPVPARLRELGYGEPATSRRSPTSSRRTSSSAGRTRARRLLVWYRQRPRRSTTRSASSRPRAARACWRRRRATSTGRSRCSTRRSRTACPSRWRTPGRCSRAGIVLRRAKRRRDARASLGGSAIFERLGALRWAERARGGSHASPAGRPQARPSPRPRAGSPPRRRGPLEQGGRRGALRHRQGRRGAPLAHLPQARHQVPRRVDAAVREPGRAVTTAANPTTGRRVFVQRLSCVGHCDKSRPSVSARRSDGPTGRLAGALRAWGLGELPLEGGALWCDAKATVLADLQVFP